MSIWTIGEGALNWNSFLYGLVLKRLSISFYFLNILLLFFYQFFFGALTIEKKKIWSLFYLIFRVDFKSQSESLSFLVWQHSVVYQSNNKTRLSIGRIWSHLKKAPLLFTGERKYLGHLMELKKSQIKLFKSWKKKRFYRKFYLNQIDQVMDQVLTFFPFGYNRVTLTGKEPSTMIVISKPSCIFNNDGTLVRGSFCIFSFVCSFSSNKWKFPTVLFLVFSPCFLNCLYFCNLSLITIAPFCYWYC